MTVDLYDILGVPRDADDTEIKRAFRQLAQKYHPDHNPGDPDAEQRFKEALAAFEILSDAEQRRRYDRFGLDGVESADTASFEESDGESASEGDRWWAADPEVEEAASEVFGEESFDFSYFEEIGDFDFSEAFEPDGFGPGPRDGDDVVQTFEVGLVDALRGAEVDVEVDGEALRVRLEEGVETGDRMRVPGHGEPAPDDGGDPGDLLLDIEVDDHPNMRRDGRDLELDVRVTLVEAALGATIDVPTPWGAVRADLTPGTDSADRIIVEGEGIRRKGERGDLALRVLIVTPDDPGPSVRKALRTVEEAYDRGIREGFESD